MPLPPWDMESAAERLQLLENDFNSLDAKKVSANYAADAEVRYGTSFLRGREQVAAFFGKELSEKIRYKLKLDLWGALKGRMAVRFELEWTDTKQGSRKNYGVEVFQFDANGLIELNFASFNEV